MYFVLFTSLLSKSNEEFFINNYKLLESKRIENASLKLDYLNYRHKFHGIAKITTTTTTNFSNTINTTNTVLYAIYIDRHK